MSKGNISPERDETTIEEEDIATHQEAIPFPLSGGKRLVAVRFLDEARHQIEEQAPDERPGKK